MKKRTFIAAGLALGGTGRHVRPSGPTKLPIGTSQPKMAVKTAALIREFQGVPGHRSTPPPMTAVNGIVGKYTPYFVTESAPPGARPEAAAAQAAYTALKALFPAQTTLSTAQLADSLAKIAGNNGNSRSIARGRVLGPARSPGHPCLARAGWLQHAAPPYFGSTTIPGVWRSIPSARMRTARCQRCFLRWQSWSPLP